MLGYAGSGAGAGGVATAWHPSLSVSLFTQPGRPQEFQLFTRLQNPTRAQANRKRSGFSAMRFLCRERDGGYVEKLRLPIN